MDPAPDALGRLSDACFDALAHLIENHVGIKLANSKRTMVEGRLRRRVRALGFPCLDAYAAHVLDHSQVEGELIHLIDCVTTNKTDFFREPAHFDFLQDEAIPALIGKQSRRPARIKVWSAACSTGAEAYTIAMVLEGMRSAHHDFRYSILGTDISTQVLDEARAAVYASAMVEPVPAPFRTRFLMIPKDPSRSDVRIVPELRRTARFERLNLMDPGYFVDTDVDVIFCRNVLIYFDKPTQQAVVERLAAHLRPGGYLLLGHSESMVGTGMAGLRQVRPTVFQAVASEARHQTTMKTGKHAA